MAISKLGWAGIGLVVGAASVAYAGSKEYATLRQQADSLANVAMIVTSGSHTFSDSIQKVVDSLQKKKAKVVSIAIKDTASARQADSAMRAAKTSGDSIKALQSEVVSLRDANDKLFLAIATDSLSIIAEQHRGDSLQVIIDGLNGTIQDLRTKINALHGTPKWLSISFEVLKVGGAFAAGYGVGKK